MRLSLALFALPLALALPSTTSTVTPLHALRARTFGFPGQGNNNGLVCGTIPVSKKKYICACYDLGEDTCYRADSGQEDNVVNDDGLISTVIRELEGTAQLCYLPEHAKPDFKKGCCVYKCKKGYKDCGNKCIKKNKTCSTAKPNNPHKRELIERQVVSSRCSAGQTACSVGGGASYECLSTEQDVESCGGCLNPSSFNTTVGQDCTALAHAEDVSCISGQCQIHSCAAGYKPDATGELCVSSQESLFFNQKYRL